MKDLYNPTDIETRWQKVWKERQTFKADRSKGKKYYVLEMFPYPSGRIHIGHVRNYAIGDVVARYKKACGYQVIHPMGWDAFGLPAENAAIDRGIHPWRWTYDNIDHMRKEIKRLGYTYDWDLEIATCHPGYYKWEQFLFIKMLEKGLVYQKTQFVNFCNECKTVLANEQARDGKCERCGTLIVSEELPGWYFKITDYAQELLESLDKLEGKWDKRVIFEQKKWIGRSEGVEVDFPLKEPIGSEKNITIFTTRPDTLFGVTFMSLAAEHPLALALAHGTAKEEEVTSFVQKVRSEDKKLRTDESAAKEGVFTGRYCINPLTGDKIPIYVANFVLMDYGTGAVMAVPGHDQRDFEFSKVYKIPIKIVIQPKDEPDLDPQTMECAYVDEGIQVNSGPINGLNNKEGMEAVAQLVEEQGCGRRAVSYRLRDWSVSRQRYWGCPIPIIHCETCGPVPEKFENLPVLLPKDIEITGKGGSPLAKHPSFSNAICPKCHAKARRETDIFDTFVESSWYQHRYLCPRFEEDIVDKKATEQFMPVDQYIGGIEHATGHLMYTRFFNRVLRDLGYTKQDEPAERLLCQGMVCMETMSYKHPDGRINWVNPEDVDEDLIHKPSGQKVTIGRSEKMSKSKYNTVAPQKIIDKYGADTVLLFVLSDSPPESDLHWSDQGIEGGHKFLIKVWKLFRQLEDTIEGVAIYNGSGEKLGKAATDLRRLAHSSLQRITQDVDGKFSFNTAIARIRELTEGLRQAHNKQGKEIQKEVFAEAAFFLLRSLNLFTPHITEEIWESIGGKGLISEQPWPQVDEEVAAPQTITMVIQVNGKLRARIEMDPNIAEEDAKESALEHEQIKSFLKGKEIKKVIFVKGRLVNIVAR